MKAALLFASFLMTAMPPAWAGPVVTLSAEARNWVPNDEMVVVVAAERDGPDVAALNDTVLRQLNDAIAQARRNKAISARLAGVYTSPLYVNQANGAPKPNGYRVSGQVQLTSNDFVALSALIGDLGRTLQIAGVSFRLTPARRDSEEQTLLKSAADAFRARAGAAARAFDLKEYELKTMDIGTPSSGPMPLRAMAFDAAAKSSASLPVEGGDSDVVVTISGTVELR